MEDEVQSASPRKENVVFKTGFSTACQLIIAHWTVYMSRICVVHLVWGPVGLNPFKNFISSYLKYNSGLDHDLLVVFKDCSMVDNYLELLKLYNINFITYFRENVGYDIDTYLDVSNKYSYDFFCFINSCSIILDNYWLCKLYNNIVNKDVGIVGATGSWESHSHNTYLEIERNIVYNIIRHIWRQTLKRILIPYDPFPNYHVRTNAFMISRNLFNYIGKDKPLLTKENNYRFESGKNGLSKQILKINLKLLVVGKDGIAYEKEDWFKSKTFWQGDQENLLISDNRTNDYQNSDFDKRVLLSQRAWGDMYSVSK